MTGPVAFLAVPDTLRPLVAQALGMHPGLTPRDGVLLETLRRDLIHTIDVRVHSDAMPWWDRHPWIGQLVEAELTRRLADREGRRSLWCLREADAVAETRELLGEGPFVLVAFDGRHGLTSDSGALPRAVAAGRAWARAIDAVRPLATATLGPNVPSGVEVLDRLGLPAHAATAAALDMLARLPAPALSPEVDAAFRAWPAADALLTAMGRPSLHPQCTAPSAEAARARWALDHGDPLATTTFARQALAGPRDDDAWAEAIDCLAEAGAVDEAVDALERWRVATDAAAAWSRLLALTQHPASAALIARAARHADPEVRGAAARWLVAHGLDGQAAEVATRSRDAGWADGA